MFKKRIKSQEDKLEPRSNKIWQPPIKILVGERNGFCYYYDGFVVEKHLRITRCGNNYIKKSAMTLDDYRFLEELDFMAVYQTKKQIGGRPRRSYDVNLYGSCEGFGAINKQYHYFSGK